MADVIAAVEVIRREIRLEMARDGAADIAREQRLVAVQKRRARLARGLHHLVHGVRREHVVMVGKAEVLPRRQRGGGVRIGGNALILNFSIEDAGRPFPVIVLRLILPHELAHLGVGVVAGVGEAQLPVRAGLREDAVQQRAQKARRRIVQRHADADDGPVQRAVIERALRGKRLPARQKAPPFAAEAPPEKRGRAPERGAEAVLPHAGEKEREQLAHALELQLHRDRPFRELSFRVFK